MLIDIIALLASALVLSVVIAGVTGENVAADMFKPIGIVLVSGIVSYKVFEASPDPVGLITSIVVAVLLVAVLLKILYKFKRKDNFRITGIYTLLHLGWVGIHLAQQAYWRWYAY